jgi:signal transduction histidine kinase
MTAVRLAEILAEVSNMLETPLASRRLAYDAYVDPELVVSADPEKLRQILLNLLSNAIKFTEAGGRITVDTAVPEAETERIVHLRVTDTGIGIPPDRLDSIFDPFVQVHRNLTSTIEGTGLGLAISRDLARGMGGELSVRSIVGQGSTFTLTLPRSQP